ncbi:MAG: thiosulfate oxidation carrier protein SoxY [Granulosicoccus sp.]
MTIQFSPNRRKLLGTAAAIAAAGFFGTSQRAFATLEDIDKAIAEFGGGSDVQEGKITLTAPEIAENGNSVPISVSVESAMTEDEFVESVMILAEGNPSPDVATFHFTPASGKAVGSTRMRLAQTQNIVAIAKMSDGTLYRDTRNVKVTIGGCGG